MIVNPYVFGGGGGIVTDNLVFELDAADYTSGETWANQVASPADGSGQTAYDYARGGSTSPGEGSEPTHNGTPGVDPCYWSFDGGDFFTLIGSATTFLQAMHKSGAQWTLEAWVRTSTGNVANIAPMFDSGTTDQGGTDVSRGVVYFDHGDSISGHTYNKHGLRVKRDSSGATALSVVADGTLSDSTIYMLAASIDGTGGVNSFLYRNGAYDPVSSANTWDGTFATPGSSNPAESPRLGARGDTFARVPSGTRLYLLRAYNANLSKAQLDQNWDATRARYGL